ncbi:MAG TPA: class I SAM-dependent methyltransferase [Acidimicrobiia bacterium]
MATPATNLWVGDDHAARYLQSRGRIPHRLEGYDVLVEVVPERVGRVLDLGTGDGCTLAMVLDARPGSTGVGVDFNREMHTHFETRFAGDDRVDLVAHNLDEPLPATLGRFDLVVSSFAIHHCMPERQRALYGEVRELLDPGGTFVNLEHVDSPTPELHLEFLALLGTKPEDDDPSNQLVRVDVQLQWLRDLGFEQVDNLWRWRELALLHARKPS